MKKFYLFCLVLALGNFAGYSQTINATSYPFAASTDVMENMSSGTTQLIGANNEDGSSLLTNIGFTFYYAGVGYTQLSVKYKADVRMGGLINSPGATTDYSNSLGSANQTPAIAPYWDDLYTGTNGKVHYKMIGTAPNRKFIVEWMNMEIPYVGANNTGAGNFQLWLTETSGKIDFVYGSGIVANAGGASIGINKTATAFASVSAPAATVSYAVANNANTGAITAGTKYTFDAAVTTPVQPTTATFSNVAVTSMDINWVDNSTNETFFIVKRSTSAGGPFTQVGTVASGSTGSTGNPYSFSNTGLLQNTVYYYQIEAANETTAPSSDLLANQSTNPAGNISSTGTGGLWSATSTWVGGVLPTLTDIVTIADGATVTIDVAASAYSVTIGSGASGILNYENTIARTLTVSADVTINTGGSFLTAAGGTVTTHVLSLAGNIVNSGTLDFAIGTAGTGISFTGSNNSTFSGTGGTTDLYSLNPAKSSVSQVIEFNLSNFSVRGLSAAATGALLTSNSGTGTVKFSGTNTFAGNLWSAAGYTIPATMGLWLNNQNFTVNGQNGSPTNNGLLRMTQGTYNIGTASGNSITGAAATTTYIIEGGAINVTGRLITTGTASYTQSGGTVTVATVGNASSGSASFQMGAAASSFTMSGGTIIIVQRNTNATAANRVDYAVVGGKNITGGTLQIGSAATATNFDFTVYGYAPFTVVNNTGTPKTLVARTAYNIAIYYGGLSLLAGTTATGIAGGGK